MNDGLIMSETLATGAVALAILLAYRFGRTPDLAQRGVARSRVRRGDARPRRARPAALVMVLPVALFARLARRSAGGCWLFVAAVPRRARGGEPVADRQPHPLRRAGAVLHQRRPHDLRRQQPRLSYYGSGTGLWALAVLRRLPAAAERARARSLDAVERPPLRRGSTTSPTTSTVCPWSSRHGSARVWSAYAPGYMAELQPR